MDTAKRLLFALIALSSMLRTTPCHSLACNNILRFAVSDAEVLALQEQMDAALILLSSSYGTDEALNAALNERGQFLQEQMDQIYEEENRSRLSYSNLKIEVEKILDSTESYLQALLASFITLNLNTKTGHLPAGPSDVEAGRSYEVHPFEQTPFKVVFTQEIVDTYFRSGNPLRERAGKKFLKAIKKGFIGKNMMSVSGIKPLIGAPDVYEVRILGANLKFRLGGYVDAERTLHLIFHTEASEHSSDVYIQKFITSIRSAQR